MSKKNGPEPFFRKPRKRWYVEINGVQINLGPDETAARVRWHQLMSGVAPTPRSAPVAATGPLVYAIVDLFVGWSKTHRPGRTAEWYQTHLESFLDSLPDRWDMGVDDLKPFHVVNWVDAHTTPTPGRRAWGPNHRRGAITAVQRCFTWAAKMGHIDRSPVRGVEKPPPKRREQVLTPAEFDDLLARAHDQPFRDVLTFSWETGCRVQEIRLIEAAHVRFDRGRIELPPGQAKGKKRWRFIYLTPAAEAIIARLMAVHPCGVLFRNADRNPWDPQNFNNRFCRLQQRLGREELARQGWVLDPAAAEKLADTLPPACTTKGVSRTKDRKQLVREARKKLKVAAAKEVGTKYALTAIRHSFATRMLEAGMDHLTVSALLGHADGTMLAKVYSHVGKRTDYLRDELVKVASAREGASASPAA